jgi:environmental stress-induced protein Ves
MTMKIIRYAELLVIPWKNGAGVRRDLLSGERADPDVAVVTRSTWMIGLADLNQDAPFSSYPGVSRWFMPIGNGRLTLLFKVDQVDRQIELHGRSDAHFFSGDDTLIMLLHDGPMTALNVMTTGLLPSVTMERRHCDDLIQFFSAPEGDQNGLNFLLIETGQCRISSAHESHVLKRFDSVARGTNEPITVHADENVCDVILVRMRY